MKHITVLLAATWLPLCLQAEEAAPPAPFTGIPGPLSGGRFVPPPPPPPPKPVPAMRIESAAVHRLPGRNLTILRGEPSTLPDIPGPAPAPGEEELAARRNFHGRPRESVQLQLGAMIFDRSISYVNWMHPEDSNIGYEAVVALDFSIFASASGFLYEGVIHNLFLLHSNIDTTDIQRRFAWYRPISHPFVPAEGFMILKGDPADAAGTAPLRKLMALYAIEKEKLLQAHAERLQALREAAEWARRNPASKEPKDHTFWLRPHRNSRYIGAQGEGDGR